MKEDEGRLIMYGQINKPPIITILSRKRVLKRKIKNMDQEELDKLEQQLNKQLEDFLNNLTEEK